MTKPQNILPVYKPIGITPFDAIKILKGVNPEIRDQKMAYAGRLDPMAGGILLLISGDELKKFNDHLKLTKAYRAKILFGFSTDSYDLLGFPKKEKVEKISGIEDFLTSLSGANFTFQLPPFSSYKIKGEPLFKWALEGRLSEIDIPTKTVKIEYLKVKERGKIGEQELKKAINKKIDNVIGNFRQKKIKKEWRQILTKEKNFPLYQIDIRAESGFYVRSLADIIGKKFNTGGVLFDLERTRLGDYQVEDTINPWDFL